MGERFILAARRDNYELIWLYDVPDAAGPEEFAGCVPEGGMLLQQEGDDLGERLRRGTLALRERGYTRALVISSDSPQLPAALVRRAFEALEVGDTVLGPAFDGGYYLLGQRTDAVPPDLFTGIQMSTAKVCAETLARASALGLDISMLPAIFDVDTAADLPILRAALGEAPSELADPAPLTLAALERLAGASPVAAPPT